jgi:uncharacterized membrane protein YcaP (DUF421 family)
MDLLPADWSRVLAPQTPLLELVARGSILYLAILAVMRVSPRRAFNETATMDLIFMLLLAEAAARALGDYTSVADGLVVILTVVGWNRLTNFASDRVPFLERLMSSPPLQVIRDGRLLRRNMRREYLTEHELMGLLREQGVEDAASVKAAFVEGDGSIKDSASAGCQ